MVRGVFVQVFCSGFSVWKVLSGWFLSVPYSVRIPLLQQKVQHHFQFHVSYVWQKNLKSVTSHSLGPLPSVTNCHTFSEPLPLERDVLYGRPLITIIIIINQFPGRQSAYVGLRCFPTYWSSSLRYSIRHSSLPSPLHGKAPLSLRLHSWPRQTRLGLFHVIDMKEGWTSEEWNRSLIHRRSRPSSAFCANLTQVSLATKTLLTNGPSRHPLQNNIS